MASTIENKLDTIRDAARRQNAGAHDDEFNDSHAVDLWRPLYAVLRPLASLKLSVALFALGIAIVLAGTFAQARMPIDDAIGTYFRIQPAELIQDGWFRPDRLFVWVPINTFLVPSFGFEEPPLSNKIGIVLPKGWTVGLVMMLNLLAAHIVRFRVQSDGMRLAAGLGVMTLGGLVTAIVVMSGQSADGFQETPIISYNTLWLMLQVGLFLSSLASFYGAYSLHALGRVKRGLLIGVGGLSAALCAWTLLGGQTAQLDDAYMRILYQLIKGTLAGLILLGGAWLAFGKRAGIVVIHLGVGILMASEVFVGLKAVESQMMIGEGESSNFLMDPNIVELAIIDHKDPEHPGEDVVSVIPQSMLIEGRTIDDERLPFTIEVEQFFANIDFAAPTLNNPATHGLGVNGNIFPAIRGVEVTEADRVVGTDAGDKVDLPSAYVTLKERETGEEIGTWLVSSLFDTPVSLERFPGIALRPQYVPVPETDDDRWEIALRRKRTYVPFTFTLHDVEADHYVGTETARSYEALVRVENAEDGFERDNVKIWMNNPLRYAGLTFYQSNYMSDRISQGEVTVLQVVSNHGWMLPYLSCMIVAVGLAWQFGSSLVRFIDRRTRMAATSKMSPIEVERRLTRNERRQQERDRSSQVDVSDGSVRVLAGHDLVILCFFVAIGVVVNFSLRAGLIPGFFVMLPFVALAYSVIHTMKLPPAERSRTIVPWIMGLVVAGYLLTVVNLARYQRPAPREFDVALFGRLPIIDGGRVKPIDSLARNALMGVSDVQTYEGGALNEPERLPAVQWLLGVMTTPVDENTAQVVRIDNDQLLDELGLEHRHGLRYSTAELEQERLDEIYARNEDLGEVENSALLTAYQRALKDLDRRINVILRTINQFGAGHDQLKNDEYVGLMRDALIAYKDGDARSFNHYVFRMHQMADDLDLGAYTREDVSFEAFYNGLALFFHASNLSIIAFLLVAGSWLGWSEPLRKAAFVVMGIAFAVATFAIVARIAISGRPPVTNLYSSAVFIAWTGILFGLVFECIYRNSMGLAVSTIVGMLALKVSHALAMDGDTFTVLQAVLDTQFWLATHVVTITMGYATTYVAGLFGLMYLLTGLFSDMFPHHTRPQQIADLKKNLVRMMYGTLCFALLFSFIGTVLGGLWADDSWGRFWGWDPKENGALIIVLWNAMVLHARWDRIVRDRGLAALCVLGNITVSWSWFGTNALQIGLHSYGFKDGVLFWLSAFMLSQIAVACLGFRRDGSQPTITDGGTA